MSRLTLDIRGKKTEFSLPFPCFEDKPVRLVEDWRSLLNKSKIIIILKLTIEPILKLLLHLDIANEISYDRSTVYYDT